MIIKILLASLVITFATVSSNFIEIDEDEYNELLQKITDLENELTNCEKDVTELTEEVEMCDYGF